MTRKVEQDWHSMRLSKSNPRFWESRIVRRSWRKASGETWQSPDWYVRLRCLGMDQWFNLRTAERGQAAVKAREIYTFLLANGVQATRAKYCVEPASESGGEAPTFGQWFDAVRGLHKLAPETLDAYIAAARTIIGEVFGIRLRNKTAGPELDRWRERIGSVKLQALTLERVNKWARARISAVQDNPAQALRAKRSVNSLVGRAASLFHKKLVRELHIALPAPLPFSDFERFCAPVPKYSSRINLGALTQAAERELSPEPYKVFLLAAFAGLRRNEIDKLEWSMVDFAANAIRLCDTDTLSLKTDSSAAEVLLPPSVALELRNLKPSSKSKFVVALQGDYCGRYRCYGAERDLIRWLRGKGVTAQKPIHELRKEAVSIMCQEHGIYAASGFARHSQLSTTARHYADPRNRFALPLDNLFTSEVQEMTNEEQKTESGKNVSMQ